MSLQRRQQFRFPSLESLHPELIRIAVTLSKPIIIQLSQKGGEIRVFKRLGQVFLLQHVGLVHGERLPVGVPRDDIIVRIVRHHVPRLPAHRFRIPSRVSPSVLAHSCIHSSLSRAFPSSSPPPIVSSAHRLHAPQERRHRHRRERRRSVPPISRIPLAASRFRRHVVVSCRVVSAREGRTRLDRVSRLVRVSRSLAFSDARTIYFVSVASRWRLARWRLARAGTRGEK